MSIRIGINPLTWTNDDLPDLGGDTPLETCLAEAREAGYAGIELGNKFPRDPRALAPLLDAHRLALVSGWYGSRLLERGVDAEMVELGPHLDLLRAMGCAVTVFAEVSGCVHGERGRPLSARPRMDDPSWARLCAALDEVAARTLERGVRVAYHHHMGTVIETEADVDRLMASTSSDVGLLLDTGHLTYAGGDPAAVAARHRGRIAPVHCKDVRPGVLERARATDQSFLDAVLRGVFTVPGDGAIDFGAVLAALLPEGYRGWLVVEAEQDPAIAHPLTYARLGFENLRRLVDATPG